MLILLITILLFVIPSTALAEVSVKQMQVSVWPEYDKKEVLVILAGKTFSQKISKATFFMPGSIQVTATHSIDKKNNHLQQSPQISKQGQYTLVTYPMPYLDFDLEGYYNPIAGQGSQKSFTHTFKAPYGVNDLYVYIQQPLKATDFKVTPSPQKTQKDEKGFNYALYYYSGIKKGQEFNFKVSYSKSDPNPSVSSQDSSEHSSSGMSGSLFLVILGAIIVACSVAFGIVCLSKTSASPVAAKGSKRGKSAKFCINCGATLPKEAKFCPSCGKAARQ